MYIDDAKAKKEILLQKYINILNCPLGLQNYVHKIYICIKEVHNTHLVPQLHQPYLGTAIFQSTNLLQLLDSSLHTTGRGRHDACFYINVITYYMFYIITYPHALDA